MKQEDNKEYIEEYTKLIQTLGLENINTFQQKSEEFKLTEDSARTVIDSVFDDDKINHFYKLFDLSKEKTLKNKISEILLKRGDGFLSTKDKKDVQSKEKSIEEVSMNEKRKQVTIYFLNLIALFILFEDDNEKDCTEKDVKLGLDNISHIKQITHFNNSTYKDLCDDDSEKNVALKCYLRMLIEGDIGDIEDKKLKQELNQDIDSIDIKVIKYLLETFNTRLHTFQNMVEIIKKDNMTELINIYCNIKNSFLMIKEKYHPENMSIKPCSKSFIQNEKILKIIRERLTVRTSEKEQHGEVFTPPELVCEMLDTLPASVWEDKDLKWLDPANGIGNFPVITYYKLMEGLKKAIPDDKKRSKHIIEDMLFMVELNPVNVKVSKKIFKMMDSDAKPNIVKANFLTESSKWKRELGRDTFDIVMGNPPYNEGGIRSKVGSKENKTTLWIPFIESAVKFITTNGYLLFITPNTWTELTSSISDFMLGFQIDYIRSYNYSQALTLFGKQSGKIPLSYFLLKKVETKNDTFIWDNHHKIFIKFNIYENNFIPNFNVSIFKKVLKRSENNNLDNYFINTQAKSKDTYNKEYSSVFLYPLLNYSYNRFNLFYSKKCFKGHNNIPKLVFSNFSMGYPILDNLGVIDAKANMCFLLQLSNNNISDLQKIQRFFLTPLVFLLINSLKTKQNFMSNRIFHVLPDVTTLDFDITDDKLLYKYFNFDKKDIEAIEEQIKSGEGNLTPKKRKAILDFDIHKYMTESQIKTTIESIVKNCNKPSKTLKKKPSSNSSTKTRKSPPKSKTKSPSPPKSTKTIKTKKKLNIVSELKGGKKSNKTLKKR